MFEKLYFIHNPLNGLKDWISEREFKIGSQKLKNVFGVLYLNDVGNMLQFNNQFKESVMREYRINNERNLSIQHVCRKISRDELFELVHKETVGLSQSDYDTSTYPPFSTMIELKDGCFLWNKEKGCLEEVPTDNMK
jgi:hypothetical protein